MAFSYAVQCDGDASNGLYPVCFFDSSALLASLTKSLAVLCARAVLAWPGRCAGGVSSLYGARPAIRRLHLPSKPSCRRHPLDAAVQRRVGSMGGVKPDTDLSSLNLPLPMPRHYRAIWLSDVHLGASGCQAEYLLDFCATDSDVLYLVGDIVDGWQLKKSWRWPQSHNDIVQKCCARCARARRWCLFPAITTGRPPVCRAGFWRHRHSPRGGAHLADGRRLLVTHGDEFDG